MRVDDLQKLELPDTPGVYRFMRGETILYIGKATSLRDRVRSYFGKDLIKTRGRLLVDMVAQAETVQVTETDSVLEALVLEAELIKKHQPIYNTKEKDNKSYNFVVFTKEPFPRVLIERGRSLSFDTKPYSAVYGPFPSQQQLREALKIIRKIFPFKTDATDSRLYQQLGLEPDTSDTEAAQAYKQNLRNVKLFFQGKKQKLLKALEKQMQEHAKRHEFERAAKVRNQIFALNHIRDVSLLKHDRITSETGFRIEAYDAAHMSGRNSVGVMTVVEDGEVAKAEYRKFVLRYAKRGDDVGSLEEILTRRLKHDEWTFPDLIVVDGGVGQRNRALQVLQAAGRSIPVVSVVKNDKHKPERFIGPEKLIRDNQKAILLANNEAHRYAINFYRSKHRKSLRQK